MKIDKSKVSDTAWSDVDKSALGKALADGFAKGTVTRAHIKEVYAYVPPEAFGKDSDGKPTFTPSKAWGPHHEVSGDAIVLNRAGLGAAAAAVAGGRSTPSLSEAALAAAKRHLRKHYRQIKEDAPKGLSESLEVRVLERGKPLEELVKGSMDYTLDEIRRAFRDQFSPRGSDFAYYICETFADHVIVSGWRSELAPDEYYRVGYTRDGESFTFDPVDQWEIVELTYQPQTTETVMAEARETPIPDPFDSAQGGPSPAAQGKGEKKRGNKRFDEQMDSVAVTLLEATSAGGPRRIRIDGAMTLDVVNGNRRRYGLDVGQAAIDELRTHLHESAGQGRAIQLLGEAEHPSGKASKRPNLLETVVKWNEVALDGRSVNLEGHLLETSRGKDILALLEGGVQPGVSMRGYGDARMVTESGRQIEEVTELHITGFDLVLEPSFQNVVTLIESQQESEDMDPEKMKAFIAEHPELFEGLLTKKLEEMQTNDLKSLEESVRKMLGIDEKADLGAALKEAVEAKRTLDESKHQAAIDTAIAEQTKELPYGKELNEQFTGAVRAAKPATAEAVKALVESKRTEYDAIVAKARLAGMGFRGTQVVGPVLENETGVPEFARASFEFSESLVRAGAGLRRDFRKPKTANELYTAQYLERFDKLYGFQLKRESKLLEEAEQTSDLNLPYSVSRSIVAEVMPRLIAISVFDFGVTEQTPTRIYFEHYAAETGTEPSVTGETVVADHDAWVAMDYKRVKPGTVVVTDGGATTYVENTDYLIDYANGSLMALSDGAITDAQSLTVDYDYYAVRKGEMQPIARAKGTLDYISIEALADRLATQISTEAVLFSRSQIGWDAVVRTQTMLLNQIRRRIDEGAIYLALSAALSVANNSGGGWVSGTNTPDELAEMIGQAKVKVINRYYEPTAVLLSAAMSDTLANAEIFAAAGARPDSDLRAEGFVGRVKGLACFESTEMPDSHVLVLNREIVAHRVYQPMAIKGPFPSYHTDGTLIAAEQYYAEEFNATAVPVKEKAAYVVIS